MNEDLEKLRRELEEMRLQVEQVQQEWSGALNAVRDPIFMHDTEFRIVRCNHAYQQCAGLPMEQIIGQPYYNVFPKTGAPLRHCQKTMETGIAGDEEDVVVGEAVYRSRSFMAHDAQGLPHAVHILEDITERRKIERRLRLSRALIDNSSDDIEVLDPGTLQILDVNETTCRTLGYSREELLSMNIVDIDPELDDELLKKIETQLKKSGSARFESIHRRKDGSVFPVEVSAKLVELDRPYALDIVRDITERKRSEQMLRENESRLKDMFENLKSGVAVYRASADGQDFFFTSFNQAAEQIEQVCRADLIGKNVVEAFPSVAEFGLLEAFRRVWKSGTAEHALVRCRRNGEIAGWRDNYIYKLPNGEIVAIYDDVTAEKEAEERIHHLAHYDALTDLPNRTLFADRLHQAIAIAKREKTHFALLFLDLDKFKRVNDELGHDVGDLLLKAVAQRLRNCLRESDTVSRMGGDEFVILLLNVKTEQAATKVAEKILHATTQPFELAGHTIHISSSIGVAIYPEHGHSEKQLTKHADTAMYCAKSSGRSNVQLYQPDMSG